MVKNRNIRRQKLPNGLTVITEQMQHIRSASIGIWMKTGSRDEDAELNGISHFIEHMVFKGHRPHRRGHCPPGGFHRRQHGRLHRQRMHLLQHQGAGRASADGAGRSERPGAQPRFDAEEITREHGVILEEIKMDEDNPDYLVHEIFTQNFWKDHPLGKPILGTSETVKKFEQRRRCLISTPSGLRPGNMIVSAAGNLNHDRSWSW